MKRIILFSLLLFSMSLFAQESPVSNVVAKQVGDLVEISYYLSKPSQITLSLSIDGGKSYTYTPKAVKGDIGTVQRGQRKIVWAMLEDRPEWEVSQARFKINAKVENLTFTVGGVSFKMQMVEGGSFTMGCTSEQGGDCESDENPSHQVTLSDYFIGQTEVTQGLWRAVMGSNPSYFQKGDNYPVEKVSWNDCQEFIRKLNNMLSSELDGKRFCLPTEAQWEYAARGGKKSGHYKYAGSNNIGSVAWYGDNSDSSTHPVGQKVANELGLYDMSGNVWEWCHDWNDSYTGGSQTNPTGAASGYSRVYRGGSWYFNAWYCRVSNRDNYSRDYSYCDLGLRLVLVP